MTIVVSAAEMRRIDASCGIASGDLMENAGRASLEAAMENPPGRTLVIAGKGNNGGDGCVLARLLKENGVEVEVCAIAPESELKGDAAAAMARARASGVAFIDLPAFEPALGRADLVVDALLGTGARPEPIPREMQEIVTRVNAESLERPELRVLALDLPSGICADTGQVRGRAIRAHTTVTFGRAKRGLMLYPGVEHAGRVVTDPIGIPEAAFESAQGCVATSQMVADLLPKRTATAHKAHAKVLVIGGAAGMSGAARLAAYAALRGGAGYAFIAMPEGSDDTGWPVEAVRRTVPARVAKKFDPGAQSMLIQYSEEMHAVVVGGGFGRGGEERPLAGRLVRLIAKPAVVDADALRLAAIEDFRGAQGPRLLTPHAGEFAALFGGHPAEAEADRVGRALSAADKSRSVVMLKGRPTVIAAPDGRYVINPTGNELLATCGSGDVLAGILGALLAQGVSPFDAAICGAYLHGLTASLWPHPVGLTATDIANLLPQAWGAVGR